MQCEKCHCHCEYSVDRRHQRASWSKFSPLRLLFDARRSSEKVTLLIGISHEFSWNESWLCLAFLESSIEIFLITVCGFNSQLLPHPQICTVIAIKAHQVNTTKIQNTLIYRNNQSEDEVHEVLTDGKNHVKDWYLGIVAEVFLLR